MEWMAPRRNPPLPPQEDDTDPEAVIPTRIEVPTTADVDTLVAATHRGYRQAERVCEDRLKDARARGRLYGIAIGTVVVGLLMAAVGYFFR